MDSPTRRVPGVRPRDSHTNTEHGAADEAQNSATDRARLGVIEPEFIELARIWIPIVRAQLAANAPGLHRVKPAASLPAPPMPGRQKAVA